MSTFRTNLENSHQTRSLESSPSIINRSVAQILELFDWYSSVRMLSIIGCFDRPVGSVAQGGEGQRWRRALMDFAYRNVIRYESVGGGALM